MRSILIIGSLVDGAAQEFAEFGTYLGQAAIEAGFRVVTGGSADATHIDRHAASGAISMCQSLGKDPDLYILSVARPGTDVHGFGHIQDAMGTGPAAKRSSLINEATAVIAVGGREGTEDYIHLCEMSRKPVVPVPMFSGAAHRRFQAYLMGLPVGFPQFLTIEDFKRINRRPDTEEHRDKAARDAVELARNCSAGTNLIFVAMPIHAKFNNILEAIRSAVRDTDYVAERIDRTTRGGGVFRIDAEIEKRITNASLVLADLTDLNPNVFYEFGYARGNGVKTLPIAENDTTLPFDVQTIRTIFYDPLNLPDLTAEIAKALPPTESRD